MLIADIKGKLSVHEFVSEDFLTSAVFTAFRWLPTEWLRKWLGAARNIHGDFLVIPHSSPEFDFYYEAEEEINTNTYDKHLWDKALVESGGDQNRTKARYIELRAKQLYVEKACPVCDASLDQQAASITPDTLITLNTLIDISGTYRSDISTEGSAGNAYWALGRDPAKKVILKQNQDEIVGTFLGSRSGEIEGILNGDTIKFKWFVTDGLTESGRGEWKVTNDGINWIGTWRSSTRGIQGNWDLTKIE